MTAVADTPQLFASEIHSALLDQASLRSQASDVLAIVAAFAVGRRIEHQHDSDWDGILHWLISYRTPEGFDHWSHNRVMLSASGKISGPSAHYLTGSLGTIATRTGDQSFCTDDVPGSWIALKLQIDVRLTHYRLGVGTCICNPKSWVLEGSACNEDTGNAAGDAVCDEEWTVLSTHDNDCALGYNLQIDPHAAGSVQFNVWPVFADRGYRMFRIRQTGKNNSNTHHLCLAGVELYGQTSV